MNILIVDDEETVRSSIRRAFAHEPGVSVYEAANGPEALNTLVRHECDLVVLDLHMPGMDGETTLRAIRRSPTRANVPVVMLTGISDEKRVRGVLKLGVEDYLLKPIAPEELVERLLEILARPSVKNAV